MVQAEYVLDAPQQRVVVVRLIGDGPGLDAGRDQYRSRVAAAGTLDPGLWAVGPGNLVTARARIAAGSLVEDDRQQPVVVAERGRARDLRHPLLQELVDPGKAAGAFRVRARRVVAVAAEVGGDEHVVGRAGGARQILRQ